MSNQDRSGPADQPGAASADGAGTPPRAAAASADPGLGSGEGTAPRGAATPASVPYPHTASERRELPSTAGPRAPVPPRARLAWHVGAIVAGLALTPVALWLLGVGMTIFAPVSAGEQSVLGALWALGGAVALSAVAAVSALGSSLGLIVGGVVWGALPGVLGVLGVLRGPVIGASSGSPMPIVGAPASSLTERTATALDLLLPTGFLLAVGVALSAAGVAVHYARRAGRRQLRAERSLAATRAGTEASPHAPVPPASRLRAHLASVLIALVLMSLALVALSRAAGRLSMVADDAGTLTSDVAALLALCAAGACVAAVMLTAAYSSLGPQLAGWLMALLPGVAVVVHDITDWAWLDAPIDVVTRTPGSLMIVTTDFLVVLGVVTIVGGAAAHWSRRHGQRLERTDLALAAR